ncbi:winged helix-turn-helix domain-containing protein [Variovorax sp. dw_954]|uniref:winged helix-turn-helix domain-containing protein n=1 Tax=Variovorax sp. dw_954 TaxID=2720078 RepID=UPI001BD63B9A|nr:winged helix-turn-helix domain-containing protein [Variovorax sp. dw_954]
MIAKRTMIHRLLMDEPLSEAPGAQVAVLLVFAGFEFDPRRDELRKGGAPIALRPKPLALLRHLLKNPARLLMKDELIAALWGPTVVTDDSLVQCVGDLRAALDDRDLRLIKTLPRRGYMLDTTVEVVTPGPVKAAAAATRPVWFLGTSAFMPADAGEMDQSLLELFHAMPRESRLKLLSLLVRPDPRNALSRRA